MGVFIQGNKQLQNFSQLLFGQFLFVGQIAQPDIIAAQLNENAIHLHVIIDIFDAFLAGDLVERRLGNINKSALHQLRHLPVKKSQQEGPDMRAIHVRIGHDDDLVVAQFLDVEGAFPFPIANAGANGGDHGADFIILQHLVEAGFPHVDELAANGENGLELPFAPLFG